MERSIPRYVGIFNEMETFNILESQRLERLQTTLRMNKTLTPKEKQEAEHIKQDNEELRLTKRKALYLKKGILMAKAKVAEFQNEDKYKHLVEAEFSRVQMLPDSDDEVDSLRESVASRASTPNSLASSSIKNVYKGETSASKENPKELKDETAISLENSRKLKDETWTATGISNESKFDPLIFSKNPREHCVSECRVTRALQNDGLPLSVRIPLPVKDNEQCVLIRVEDIDKLLEETRLASERSKSTCSLLQMPTCASVSCLSSPTQSPTNSPRSRKNDQSSSSTPHLNQYDSAMNPGQASSTSEKSNSDDEDIKDERGRKCYELSAIHQIKNSKEMNEIDPTENLSITKKVIHKNIKNLIY